MDEEVREVDPGVWEYLEVIGSECMMRGMRGRDSGEERGRAATH